MKKYTILFALLTGMILLAFEAFPALQASAQCISTNGKPYVCVPPESSGGSDRPGPKNVRPTPVPTKAPTPVPFVMFGPTTVPPIVFGGPKPAPYAYPALPQIPPQNLCKIGPCWPFGINPGDPVELLAGGGFLAFLVVIGFVFFRGRNAQGGGSIQ